MVKHVESKDLAGRMTLIGYDDNGNQTPIDTIPAMQKAVGVPTLKLRQAIAEGVSHQNSNPFTVMASPPTVGSLVTTNPITGGQSWNSVTGNDVSASPFSFFRGAYYRRVGTNFPDYNYITADTFSQGFPSTYAYITLQYSFVHIGSRFSISFKGNGPQFWIRVNDQYVSLTPTTAPSDGGTYYVLVDFGSSARRRIDILGSSLSFGGITTDIGDLVTPAPKRGPRMVVLADSFGEGTGANNALGGWIQVMAEHLGWDDVVTSAVGATGILQGTAPKTNFINRAVRDVALLNPDIMWVSMSINDSSFTGAQITSALSTLLSTVNAAGSYPLVVVSSPTVNKGAGAMNPNGRNQNNAAAAWCAANGALFVNDIEIPFTDAVTPATTTLTASATGGATSIQTAAALASGAHYKFADGTVIFVRSGGTTSTIDNLMATQANGATLTQCGGSWLTGTGRVGATVGYGTADTYVSTDGTHPTQAGHAAKGALCAQLFMRALKNL